MLREAISMALYNLSRRKMRTSLTLLGIVVGIGAVVALISLGNGMEASITEMLEEFGPNKIYVTPKTSSGTAPALSGMAFGESLTEKDLERIRNIKGVAAAIPVVIKTLPVEYKGEEKILWVLGIPPKESKEFFSDVQNLDLSKGRFIREGKKYEAIVGYLIEKDTFSKDVKLRSKIKIKGIDFQVAGVLKRIGNPQEDSQIYIPLDTLREITGNPDEINVIILKASEDPDKVAKEIEKVLEKAHGEDIFMAMTAEQLQERINSIFGVMSIVLGGIASISLVVAGFGIMNTMLMSVLERTREIGIMKAIGATNREVMMIFLVETATLGFIGGVIGILFGSVLYLGIGYVAIKFLGITLAMSIQPSLIILALLFSMFVGTLSGIYPAWRAARLNPVDALRYE